MRANSVQGVRAVAFAVVRGAAVLAVVVGVWLILVVVLRDGISGLTSQPAYQGPQPGGAPVVALPRWLRTSGYSPSLHRGLALIFVALPAWLLSGWITRSVFRPPEAGCPRCRHGLDEGAARCPECGQGGLGS